MKKTYSIFFVLILWLPCFAQHMVVKRHNYTTFTKEIKKITPLLEKRSTPEDKQHPEYGIVPYNAYCSNCVELIDKRTVDSRYFISNDTESKFFIEKSYFPLHYKKSRNDVWRTIDYRLKPQSEPGIYEAVDQPAPTKCDLNRKSTSFVLGNSEFEFNHDLTLYFFDEQKAYVKQEKGNYSDYTIGDEGLMVTNFWQGIDMEQTFRAGEIETNYVINKPLQLPITDGYMVIEDHFTLPEGWTIKEAENGHKLENGYFSGDYKIGNGKGTEIIYREPTYFDAKAIGLKGTYNLKQNGNDYTLQMMVPVKWLYRPGNTYPLYIDPTVEYDSVYSVTVFGAYQSTGIPGYQYAFTDKSIGSCNDTLGVVVQGGAAVVEAYTAVEYELTYNPTCGSPPEPAPFCTFSQITQQVINNRCGTSSGVFQCNPAAPPYTGTCTTDSDLVAGAHPIRINNFAPNFLSCLSPKCQSDTLSFTLENQDSTCGDVCGYLCAGGHLFSMILVGYEPTAEMSAIGYADSNTAINICQGQTINFTGQVTGELPPLQLLWTQNGGNSYDSTGSQYQFTVSNPSGYIVYCAAVDSCSDTAISQIDTVNVISSPITIRGDTLVAPYSDAGYQWYFNGGLLPGDTFQILIAAQLGSYWVAYNDTTNGCGSSTAVINYTGIINLSNPGVSVFPNPTSGGWQLSVGADLIGGTAQIYDAIGQEVYNAIIRNIRTNISPGLANGVYQLRILDKANHSVYKQSIEKVN